MSVEDPYFDLEIDGMTLGRALKINDELCGMTFEGKRPDTKISGMTIEEALYLNNELIKVSRNDLSQVEFDPRDDLPQVDCKITEACAAVSAPALEDLGIFMHASEDLCEECEETSLVSAVNTLVALNTLTIEEFCSRYN